MPRACCLFNAAAVIRQLFAWEIQQFRVAAVASQIHQHPDGHTFGLLGFSTSASSWALNTNRARSCCPLSAVRLDQPPSPLCPGRCGQTAPRSGSSAASALSSPLLFFQAEAAVAFTLGAITPKLGKSSANSPSQLRAFDRKQMVHVAPGAGAAPCRGCRTGMLAEPVITRSPSITMNL